MFTYLAYTDERANMAKIDQLNQMLVMCYKEQRVHFISNDTKAWLLMLVNARYKDLNHQNVKSW